MKTIKLFLSLTLLFSLKTITAQEWFAHYVFSAFRDINSVSFNNSHMGGVACGDTGFIAGWLVCADAAWCPLLSNITEKNLYSVKTIDSSGITKAYIVGESGTILKSNYIPDHSGFDFYIQNSPTIRHLYSVYFTTYNTGVAVGDTGTVIRTTDGGSHWSIISSITQNKLFSVHFPNSNTAYAVGVNGTVIKTTNSGQNWSLKPQPINDTLRCVWFVSNDTGFVVSRFGTIYKTTNGGDNWQIKPSGITQSINTILFVNQTTGYAAGNSNKIIKTTNSGESWQIQTLPPLYKEGNFLAMAKTYSDGISVVGTNCTAAGTFPGSLYIPENNFGPGLFLYPNPGSNQITVNNPPPHTKIILYDLTGQPLKEQELDASNMLNTGDLKTGIYFYQLIDNKGTVIAKGKWIKAIE